MWKIQNKFEAKNEKQKQEQEIEIIKFLLNLSYKVALKQEKSNHKQELNFTKKIGML